MSCNLCLEQILSFNDSFSSLRCQLESSLDLAMERLCFSQFLRHSGCLWCILCSELVLFLVLSLKCSQNQGSLGAVLHIGCGGVGEICSACRWIVLDAFHSPGA